MNHNNEFKGPKSFSDELRRMPVDFQRRIKWTLRIGAAWTATVFIGAGVFLLSKPYMDKQRIEKLKSGKLLEEIREKEKPFSHMKRSWDKPFRNAGTDEDMIPPPYLLDVIGHVLEEEENKEKVKLDIKQPVQNLS